MNLPFDGGQGPILRPGSTIGVLGGGQLGRMSALAAAHLGYRIHVFCPEADSPAAQVSASEIVAGYADTEALDRFAAAVDVVTCEFENVPHASLDRLAERLPVRPKPDVFRIAQDRLEEKDFARRHTVATTDYERVDSRERLDAAIKAIGLPAILKTTRLGYDGKGQALLPFGADSAARDAAWQRMREAGGDGVVAILEGFVDYQCEISVIVARGLDGSMEVFTPAENAHRNHILHTSTVPARVSPILAAQAEDIGRRMAEGMGLVGLLAVELFVTSDGRLLFNEMAPRPHNSGHWTLDACATSQFEQHIRAVCGLPLGSVDRHANAVMTNLIGDEVKQWERLMTEPETRVYLYGKHDIRPGRKMGHVTRITAREPVSGLKLGEIDPMGCP